MTLEELKALYKEKGATTPREEETEQGTKYYTDAVQYGDGWTAFENDNRKIVDYIGQGMDATPVYDDAPKTLGGFSKQEGDYVTSYDPEGKYLGRQKWNESSLKTLIRDLGPLAMAAVTMGGGGAMLGNSLFGLTGGAASAAGGALAGGINAYGNDQDILKGALLGGVSGAGSAKLTDILGADALGGTFKNATVGDVTKAINFAQNPTLAGAVNIASPYMPNLSVGDGAVSLNDIFKGVGTAKALGSGDYGQIFKAITGMAGDQDKSLKSSIGPGDMDQFSKDLIPGYFQPGGEGYIDPNREEITVREEPENIDALLRSLSPYSTDEGRSVFTQSEDIPEMETVAKRPKSLADILGTPDILKEVPQDEPYISSLRTKEIKSDIPDEITPDQIATLFPNLNINDILQLVTPDATKKVTPTKTTTPDTKTTQETLRNLGLNYVQTPSQDPFADIKSMENIFGPDIAYNLRSLNSSDTAKKPASNSMDALAKLLRG